MNGVRPQRLPESHAKAALILMVALVVNLALFGTAVLMILFGRSTGSWWDTLSQVNLETGGVLILLIQVFHALNSVKNVNLNQQAILLLFGAFVKYVEPGLIYVPWGFCRLLRATTETIEKDVPADSRFIDHSDVTDQTTGGTGVIRKGYFPPIRVTFAPAKAAETIEVGGERITIPADDPYGKRNTAEVEFSYGFEIYDYARVVKRFGTDDPIGKAKNQLDDVGIGVVNDELSRMTTARAMMSQSAVANKIRDTQSTESADWGVQILFVRLKPFGFSHKLNTAVRQAAESFALKQAVVVASEGERERLTNVGTGTAEAERLLLEARAKGEAALAKVAETPGGKYAMAVREIGQAVTAARAVVVPGDNLLGAVASAAALVKQVGDVTETGTTGSASGSNTRPPASRP